jgi:hypothetical protein
LKHSNEPEPKKPLKNSQQGGIKNNKVIPKTWKGGSNKAKRKAYKQNIKKG